MKTVFISDLTLRENAGNPHGELSFKEKLTLTQLLDAVGVDVIETAPFSPSKADVLFLHTISQLVKNAVISCPVGLSEQSVQMAWEAIQKARHPRLHVRIPTSTVQMEYMCHKKPAAVLEWITTLCAKAASLCADVEFSALDATRAEPDFLKAAVGAAVAAGATTVTLCDSEGAILPAEAERFFRENTADPAWEKVTFGAEFSNATGLGAACAISALNAGVRQIKVAVGTAQLPSLKAIAAVLNLRSDTLGLISHLNHTSLVRACDTVDAMLHPNKPAATLSSAASLPSQEFTLNKEDDVQTVAACVEKLGYELSGEDMAQVFEDFQRLSQKKPIGARELEAIVASCSLQGAPVYKLKSYVINTSSLFSASAQICLEKDGAVLQGVQVGDGPIDAAFVTIESILGTHYELDDFQIRSVTEGREAMGEAIVKLRHGGKLYAGRGLSTDVIGSSIHAYVNALNKICSEEASV